MEIKYTTDGKKVVVVGNLNAQEKIVQEIFIVNGAEIPGGENFVVKSLLDAPGKSWKENETEKVEKRYAELMAQYESTRERLRREESTVLEALRAKLKTLRMTEKNLNLEAFDMASSFLLGEFKYAIIGNYDWDIVDFSMETIGARFENGRFDSLRLISLMGRTDGSLSWKLHEYCDYSGNGNSILLFKTIGEAKVKLFELIQGKKGYSEKDVAVLRKWGLGVDAGKLENLKNDLVKIAKDNIDNYEKALKEKREKLAEIEGRKW